jgi:hypothetical protein
MRDTTGAGTGLEHLTHEDLVRRIQSVDLGASEAGDGGEPRWIDAAELVRRVAPYLSHN